MKKQRILATILLTTSTLALTACGNTAPSVSMAETSKNQVVESTTTTESETAVQESVTPESADSYKQGEISGHEVQEDTQTPEDDLANFPIIDPNFNGTGHKGTLEETVQSCITYEDIEPTTMYVISNTTGERYSTYHDLNVTEGELVVSGLVDANQEIIVDGKGTYNNIDYYRIAFQEAMMLNHQIIIPAEFITAEKQETPVETEKPLEQQPTQQQPEVQQPTETLPPVADSTVPEWTPDTGVSKEDWDAFFGGGAANGGHTWEPDHGENFKCERNENGGFTITDPDIPDEIRDKIGSLIFY